MGPHQVNINTNVKGRFVKLKQNSSIDEKISMEEIHVVEDLEASPLSKPMLRQLTLPKNKMQRALDKLWGHANEAEHFTIFRTPRNIYQSKTDLFEPSVISIGPFHRGHKRLQTLEEQKWRFLRDFLSRADNISLDFCISEMKSLETRTRRCYSETFDDLDSDAFVEMMMLDGCFLLEYFIKRGERNWDSICEVGWNFYFIEFDLQLQENQIPFFIVEKLYDIIGFKQIDRIGFLKYLAHSLVPRDTIFAHPPSEIVHWVTGSIFSDTRTDVPDPPVEVLHLLHLCYHYLVPNPKKPVVLSSKPFDFTTVFSTINRIKGFLHGFLLRVLKRRSSDSSSGNLSVALPNSTGNLSSMVIPSATDLKQKGVKFTQKSNPKHSLDISFEYGVLKIPKLKIVDETKPIFANLIAFEHSPYGKENNPFTSFVYFLDNLVNTPNDVTILQEYGIVENWLSSEEELTDFLNQVTQGGVLGDDHYLAELNREVNRYIGSSWNRQRAKLIRDYFSSPWSTISVIAAFILLVLTLVQSFFAIFTYFRPPSP